jgi:hypothetical protein
VPEAGPSLPKLRERVRNLELDLVSKSRVLVSWLLVMNRNRFSTARPPVMFPIKDTVFFGFRLSPTEYVGRPPDHHQITVKCMSCPSFYSPLEVIDRLGFSPEDRYAILANRPVLHGLIPLVFPSLVHARSNHEVALHVSLSPCAIIPPPPVPETRRAAPPRPVLQPPTAFSLAGLGPRGPQSGPAAEPGPRAPPVVSSASHEPPPEESAPGEAQRAPGETVCVIMDAELSEGAQEQNSHE